MSFNKSILMGKYFSGNSSPEEEKIVLDWSKENDLNSRDFIRTKNLWDRSGDLKLQRCANVNQAWNEFLILKDKPEKQEKFKSIRGAAHKAAAAIILLFVISVLVKLAISSVSERNAIVGVKSTPAPWVNIYSGNSVKMFLLPDSSTVYLNAKSSLRFTTDHGTNDREVYLTGEAFFNIKYNIEKPFLVFCGETQTKVLGTSFNVKGYEANKIVEIAVVSGQVEVSEKNASAPSKIILLPNDKVIFNSKDDSFSKTKTSNEDLNWHEKQGFVKRLIRKIKNKMR